MIRVTSADGTEIACATSGEGQPLLLVHGGPADRTRWTPLLPHLEPHATVYAMDRRGRGDSGDGPSYDIVREFEDVAAAVDAIAELSGAAVDVYGHSFGGSCALGGATLTARIRRLVVYEPPVGPKEDVYPPAVLERLEDLVAAGDREAVVEVMFREVLGLSDEELGVFRAQPSWPARVAVAPTIPREARVEARGAFDLDLAAEVVVPTLLLTGEHSPESLRIDVERLAACLPDVQVLVLEGQEHVADVLAPEVVAEHLLTFLAG